MYCFPSCTRACASLYKLQTHRLLGATKWSKVVLTKLMYCVLNKTTVPNAAHSRTHCLLGAANRSKAGFKKLMYCRSIRRTLHHALHREMHLESIMTCSKPHSPPAGRHELVEGWLDEAHVLRDDARHVAAALLHVALNAAPQPHVVVCGGMVI